MKSQWVQRAPIEERALLWWLLTRAAEFPLNGPRGARVSNRAGRYR